MEAITCKTFRASSPIHKCRLGKISETIQDQPPTNQKSHIQPNILKHNKFEIYFTAKILYLFVYIMPRHSKKKKWYDNIYAIKSVKSNLDHEMEKILICEAHGSRGADENHYKSNKETKDHVKCTNRETSKVQANSYLISFALIF